MVSFISGWRGFLRYSKEASFAFIPFGIFQLIKPVKSHRLNDAAGDADKPGLATVFGEMLVDAVGRDIDEIA